MLPLSFAEIKIVTSLVGLDMMSFAYLQQWLDNRATKEQLVFGIERILGTMDTDAIQRFSDSWSGLWGNYSG